MHVWVNKHAHVSTMVSTLWTNGALCDVFSHISFSLSIKIHSEHVGNKKHFADWGLFGTNCWLWAYKHVYMY